MNNPLKSMTAYGRAEATTDCGVLALEIQTVNRRHFEIQLALPRSMTLFDIPLRKRIAGRIGRGHVHAALRWTRAGKEGVRVIPNLPLARALKGAWEAIGREVGLQVIDLQLFANEPELLIYEEALVDEGVVGALVERLFDEALDAVVSMRRAEGSMLSADLRDRGKRLRAAVGAVEELSSKVVDRQRERLGTKIAELFSGSPENEERILKEVALFAERVDVTEEIVRFRSHLDQVEQVLDQGGDEPRGKLLEFLLQELAREINTIGSKALDAEVTKLVVTCKSELEKMREQVQNIE